MSTNRLTRSEMESTVQSLIVELYPTLKSVKVKINLKSSYLYRAQLVAGLGTRLTFGILPNHTRFPEVFGRACTACCDFGKSGGAQEQRLPKKEEAVA